MEKQLRTVNLACIYPSDYHKKPVQKLIDDLSFYKDAEIYYNVNHDDGGDDFDLIETRLETDEEFAERIEYIEKMRQSKERDEINQLKKLKEKYPNV